MWSQPARSKVRADRGYACSLPRREWQLLVRLPGRMISAAAAMRVEPPAVDETLASLAAIASARACGGALVREVAAAIFATDDPPRAAGPDPRVPPAAVLADCLAAGVVLAERVPSADAAEYRRWLRRLADVALRDGPVTAAAASLLRGYERGLAG